MTRIKTFRFYNTKGRYIDYDRWENSGQNDAESKTIDDTINAFLEGKQLVDIKVFESTSQRLLYYTVIYKE